MFSAAYQYAAQATFGLQQQFQQQQQQQQQNAETRSPDNPPPASAHAIASLPIVRITADDLLEETNKECVVCLDDQRLGNMACKLPCGHLFHKTCVSEWLQKKCTCPVCRYELETSDPVYEAQRQKRMKSRKLRMRMDELKAKSISQLRSIASQFQVNISHCIDKTEIVDCLIKADCIIITERVPTMQMSRSDFNSMSVAQLRHLLLSFGLSDSGLIEKRELRDELIRSERIVLVDDTIENVDSSNDHGTSSSSDGSNSSSSASSESHSNEAYDMNPPPVALPDLLSQLQNLPLSSLRELCANVGVSLKGCLDKSDVVQTLLNSRKLDSTIDYRSLW
jgi:hypothetical protein